MGNTQEHLPIMRQLAVNWVWTHFDKEKNVFQAVPNLAVSIFIFIVKFDENCQKKWQKLVKFWKNWKKYLYLSKLFQILFILKYLINICRKKLLFEDILYGFRMMSIALPCRRQVYKIYWPFKSDDRAWCKSPVRILVFATETWAFVHLLVIGCTYYLWSFIEIRQKKCPWYRMGGWCVWCQITLSVFNIFAWNLAYLFTICVCIRHFMHFSLELKFFEFFDIL